MTEPFSLDPFTAATRPHPRLHQQCIGSCHAYLTLREDWREHVRRLQSAIGFRAMRFHGIFLDLVGVYREGPKGEPLYCFHNVEKIYDFLLEQGIKPFVELGFMPKAMARGTQTIFTYEANVCPPRDMAKWTGLVTAFTRHLIDRYGANEVLTWPFEVWNEPNLDIFWAGTQTEYFELYAATARALKAIDPRLQVGGPATARSAWVPEFLAYCATHHVPVDFVSTHHYCCELDFDAQFGPGEGPPRVYRGQPYMRQSVDSVRAQIAASAFPRLPLHYSEWNVSPVHEDRFGKDSEFNATFALQTLRDMDDVLASYSWWTISDIFEESGPGLAPFTGKYGLCNLHGIMKPVGHAFRFLSRLYDAEIPLPDRSALLTRCPQGRGLRLLVWNHAEPTEVDFYGKDWTIPDHPRVFSLSLGGLTGRWRERHWVVDREHGNGFRAWQRAGEPSHLRPEEVAELRRAAEAPCVHDVLHEFADGSHTVRVELPSNAFRFIELERVF